MSNYEVMYFPAEDGLDGIKSDFGEFKIVELPFNQSCLEKGSTDRTCRRYTQFIPHSLDRTRKKSYPVIFLLHEKNKTIFTTTLIKHNKQGEEEDDDPRLTSILQHSSDREYALIFLQSRGTRFKTSNRITWIWTCATDPCDIFYVNDVVKNVKKDLDIVHEGLFYLLGLQNGGVFTSNIILSLQSFRACVNYMGGMVITMGNEKSEEYYKSLSEHLKWRSSILIISSTYNSNRKECEQAKNFFHRELFTVKFHYMMKEKGEYLSHTTPMIFDFFRSELPRSMKENEKEEEEEEEEETEN